MANHYNFLRFIFFQASEMKKVSLRRSLIVNEERDYQSESSILELNFKIKKHHVRRGGIEIRCEASIMNGYHSKSKLEEIFVKTHNAENLATHNYEYRYGFFLNETYVSKR